jgi:hypothetical protein
MYMFKIIHDLGGRVTEELNELSVTNNVIVHTAMFKDGKLAVLIELTEQKLMNTMAGNEAKYGVPGSATKVPVKKG